MHIRPLISFYISLMFIPFLVALKKSSNAKETEIEKQIVGVLQQASDPRKKTEH